MRRVQGAACTLECDVLTTGSLANENRHNAAGYLVRFETWGRRFGNTSSSAQSVVPALSGGAVFRAPHGIPASASIAVFTWIRSPVGKFFKSAGETN